MQKELIERWNNRKKEVKKCVIQLIRETNGVFGYKELAKIICEKVCLKYRLYVVDNGDYEGDLFFLFDEMWSDPKSILISYLTYGSCSACDTLENILTDIGSKKINQIIDGIMAIMLHIIQRIKMPFKEVI